MLSCFYFPPHHMLGRCTCENFRLLLTHTITSYHVKL